MKFGDYLRQKREDRGWTQPEAAARAHIEQSYLSKLETGRSYPSDDVFDRLVEALGIDAAELSESVSAAELDRLREIREVRAAVIAGRANRLRLTRGWLLLGLVFLMLGGGALGVSRIDLSRDSQLYYYRSEGVLAADESPRLFDQVRHTLPADDPRNNEIRALRERIDQVDVVTDRNRGSGYYEDVENGRRYFDLYEDEVVTLSNPLRWFLVPALVFLLGSLGCFFISFRWR